MARKGEIQSGGAGYCPRVLGFAAFEGFRCIEEGATYPVQMDVDGQVYDGEATGIIIDGMPGADIPF